MSKVRISRAEKIVAFANTGLAGLGIGAGVGISTYALVTAGVGTGAGLGVAVVSAPLWITVSCVLSGAIGMGIGWYAYREYEQNAEKLLDQIEKQKDKKVAREVDYIEAQHLYTVLALRRYYMLSEHKDLIGNQHMASSLTEDPDYLPTLAHELNAKHPDVVTALSSQKELTNEQDKQLRELAQPHYQTSLKKITTVKTKNQPSIRPALVGGVIASLATFGAVLATSWGVASLVLGAGLAVGALAATPILGWGILAVSLGLGIVIGGAVAYYKYKNTKREVKLENVKKLNSNLKSDTTDIKDGQVELAKQITHINQIKNDNALKQKNESEAKLKHDNEVLRQQVKDMQAKIKAQNAPAAEPGIPHDAHLSDIQHLFNHKNDPEFSKTQEKQVDHKDDDGDNKEGFNRKT